MFQRFHRIEGAHGRTIEGSGIGLALVAELVKLHGGRIDVSSEEGRGTTFTIAIPLGTAHLPAEQVREAQSERALHGADAFVEEAARWLASTREAANDDALTSATAVQPRARVLIADDNADMRQHLIGLLAPYHSVEAVADGEAALKAAQKLAPDVLVTDVMMPKVDGLTLVKLIRADPALHDLPIVVLSARAGEDARVEGIAAGADDYLVKPFSGRELIASVNNNVRLAQLRKTATVALRESEARFRALVSATSDAIYRMSADWTEMRQLDGRGILADTDSPRIDWLREYILPEDAPQISKAIDTAIRDRTTFELEHRVRRKDGTVGWTLSRAIPIVDEGRIVEWFGMASDVTARKRAEEHQRLLVNELNHRVKNTLASVQSLARQSLRGVPGTESARDQFESRLVALAKAHDVLTQENWEGAWLRRLVEDALRPHRLGGRDRFVLQGPDAWISPRQAIALAMALHELCTNAAKYGALSNDSGTVGVHWTLTRQDPGRRLEIRWSEHDGPPVKEPTHTGFGSRLIGRALGQDLGGEVRLDFKPMGVECVMNVPLRESTTALHEQR